jgi:hypothetical protein
LGAALIRSQRGSFVRQYLYLLWPGSAGLLLELARRLGNEIGLPGEPVSLLADSLAAGANNFYRLKGRYHPATWDQNVFLHFFQGAFGRAGAVYGCRVRTVSGDESWEVSHRPFLDWRREHPGAIEVDWLPEIVSEAGNLFNLVLSGCNYPRTWMLEQLAGLLR